MKKSVLLILAVSLMSCDDRQALNEKPCCAVACNNELMQCRDSIKATLVNIKAQARMLKDCADEPCPFDLCAEVKKAEELEAKSKKLNAACDCTRQRKECQGFDAEVLEIQQRLVSHLAECGGK